jgi:uncharacterized repeat protein (TIGR01451 family)
MRVPRFLIAAFLLLAALPLFAANLHIGGWEYSPSAKPGGTFFIQADVQNDGPGTATVKITVPTPPHSTFYAFQNNYIGPTPPNCTAPPQGAKGDIVCTVSIAPSDIEGVPYARFQPDADAPDGADLGVTITYESAQDAYPGPHTLLVTHTIFARPTSYGITATPPPTVVAGALTPFTVNFTAHGPFPVHGPSVRVLNGSNGPVEYVTFTAGGGTFYCDPYDHGGACTGYGVTIAPGTTLAIPIPLRVRWTAATGSPSGATFTAAAFNDDTDASDNTATAKAVVTDRQDDVSVSVAAPATATVGDTIGVNFKVVSHGPSQSQDLVFTYDAPAGTTITYVSSSWLTCTRTGSHLSCNLPTFGTSSYDNTATVSVNLKCDAPGTLVNSGTASSALTDLNPSNNIASASTLVADPLPPPDVAVSITPSTSSVKAGSPVTLTVTAKNNGPGSATHAVISTAIPAGVLFDSVPSGCTYGGYSTGDRAECSIQTLDAGISKTLVMTVHPVKSTTPSTFTATATASAERDTTPSNNTASTSISVTPVPAADVGIQLTAVPAILQNADAIFGFTVSNAGPAPATNLRFTMETTPELSYVASAVRPNTVGATVMCAPDSLSRLICTIPTLAAGASVKVDVTMHVALTTYSVTGVQGRVSSDDLDPNGSNNTYQSAGLFMSTQRSADVSVLLTAAPTSVSPIGTVTYRALMHDKGPTDAADVKLEFTLPTGATLLASTVDGICTQPTTGLVQCRLPVLGVNSGDSEGIFVVRMGAIAGTVRATAVLTAGSTDSNLADNISNAMVTVGDAGPAPSADVTLSMAASPQSPIIGTPVTIAITARNVGTAMAMNPMINDTLPAGLEFISASAPDCSGGANHTAIVCYAPGNLSPGATWTVTITALSTLSGTVNDTASVFSDTDSNQANNTAVIAVTVIAIRPHAVRRR